MSAKKEPVNSNVNTNNNTNNIHVNIKQPRKAPSRKKEKPNWVIKAVVISALGLIAALAISYLTNNNNQPHNPSVIENGARAIEGVKVH